MSRVPRAADSFVNTVNHFETHRNSGRKSRIRFISPKEMRSLVKKFKSMSPQEQQAAIAKLSKSRPMLAKMFKRMAKRVQRQPAPQTSHSGRPATPPPPTSQGRPAAAPPPPVAMTRIPRPRVNVHHHHHNNLSFGGGPRMTCGGGMVQRQQQMQQLAELIMNLVQRYMQMAFGQC